MRDSDDGFVSKKANSCHVAFVTDEKMKNMIGNCPEAEEQMAATFKKRRECLEKRESSAPTLNDILKEHHLLFNKHKVSNISFSIYFCGLKLLLRYGEKSFSAFFFCMVFQIFTLFMTILLKT